MKAKRPSPGLIGKIGRVSDESVFKGSGRHWHEWIPILDQQSAHTWKHGEITAFLKARYKLSPWWQQGVALGFEIHRGMRVEGRNAKGDFSITVTKSLPLTAAQAWKKLVSQEGQRFWLKPLFEVAIKPGAQFETEDGYYGEVRTMLRNRRARLTWHAPDWDRKTVLQVFVVDRAEALAKAKMKVTESKSKSILVFNHEQINDARTEPKIRRRWREAADAWARWAAN